MSEFATALSARLARLSALEARFAAATRSNGARSSGTLTAPGYTFRSGTARDTVSDSQERLEGAIAYPPFVTWSCQSLTGTATLCGFSGYSSDAAPYDAGDPEAWEGQYRKWQTRVRAGSITKRDTADYADPGTPDYSYTETGTWSETVTITYDAEAEECVEDSTGCTATETTQTDPDPPVTFSVTCDGLLTYYTSVAILGELLEFYATLTESQIRTTDYVDTITTPDGDVASVWFTGAISQTLSDERYLYDALAEVMESDSEAVEVGDDCCASLESASLTSPGSTSPITLTGTASRVTITVFGDVGLDYNVVIELTRGASVTEVLVAATSPVPTTFNVPLPAPGTDPYCVTDVYLYEA